MPHGSFCDGSTKINHEMRTKIGRTTIFDHQDPPRVGIQETWRSILCQPWKIDEDRSILAISLVAFSSVE